MSGRSYYVLDFFNEHDTLILEGFCLINLVCKILDLYKILIERLIVITKNLIPTVAYWRCYEK